MVVAVIFDTDYYSVELKVNYILQMMSHAEKTDCLIITHDYFKNHFELLKNGTEERFYRELEMRRLDEKELEKIDFCFVPDKFFEGLQDRNRNRTSILINLWKNRCRDLEQFMIFEIDQALSKRGSKRPELIWNNVETIASVRALGEHYDCPVIPYVFSPIKKVHGYRVTLYVAHLSPSLFSSEELKKMQNEWRPEDLPFPLLDKKEIMALLGKTRNIPLLPLMDLQGQYEVGVAAQCNSIQPQSFFEDYATDDDIYYDCIQMQKEGKIAVRMHPLTLDRIGLGRGHLKNDPASFILSCDTIATVRSQLILKAAMWNRCICSYSSGFPYMEAFPRSVKTAERLSDETLNCILFAYLVPASLIFDLEYWRWRMEKPTANECYLYHIRVILKELGCDESLLKKDSGRLEAILAARGCTPWEIENAVAFTDEKSISYHTLSSRLQIEKGEAQRRDYYCMNRIMADGCVKSTFCFPAEDMEGSLLFYPFDDVDGFAEIETVKLNGKDLQIHTPKTYLKKGEAAIVQPFSVEKNQKTLVEIFWRGVSFYETYQ